MSLSYNRAEENGVGTAFDRELCSLSFGDMTVNLEIMRCCDHGGGTSGWIAACKEVSSWGAHASGSGAWGRSGGTQPQLGFGKGVVGTWVISLFAATDLTFLNTFSSKAGKGLEVLRAW